MSICLKIAWKWNNPHGSPNSYNIWIYMKQLPIRIEWWWNIYLLRLHGEYMYQDSPWLFQHHAILVGRNNYLPGLHGDETSTYSDCMVMKQLLTKFTWWWNNYLPGLHGVETSTYQDCMVLKHLPTKIAWWWNIYLLRLHGDETTTYQVYMVMKQLPTMTAWWWNNYLPGLHGDETTTY